MLPCVEGSANLKLSVQQEGAGQGVGLVALRE